MPQRVTVLATLAFVLLAIASAMGQKTLTATEAKDHIGEQSTVVTLVIWGSDRSKFGDPETTYRGKRVCVTGKISAYNGVPEVVANEPAQMKLR